MLSSLTNLKRRGHYFSELLLSFSPCAVAELEGQVLKAFLLGYNKTKQPSPKKHRARSLKDKGWSWAQTLVSVRGFTMFGLNPLGQISFVLFNCVVPQHVNKMYSLLSCFI